MKNEMLWMRGIIQEKRSDWDKNERVQKCYNY